MYQRSRRNNWHMAAPFSSSWHRTGDASVHISVTYINTTSQVCWVGGEYPLWPAFCSILQENFTYNDHLYAVLLLVNFSRTLYQSLPVLYYRVQMVKHTCTHAQEHYSSCMIGDKCLHPRAVLLLHHTIEHGYTVFVCFRFKTIHA
jgi:hypothetical protein